VLAAFAPPRPNGGYLVSFGKADHGKLGHGDAHHHRLLPTLVEHFKALRLVKVCSMSTYSVAIDEDGTPYIWGTGGSPTASHGARAVDILPVVLYALPARLPVMDVSCGLGHALFLVRGGRVFAWGNGGNGRLGLGGVSDRAEAEAVGELDGQEVCAVSCGASHSMALTRAGRLFSWGKNSQGQCGRGGSGEDVLRPVAVSGVKEAFCQVAAGWDHSLGLTTSGCYTIRYATQCNN
jgi:alpha-tubulin suppressor-like RCC1 family protein